MNPINLSRRGPHAADTASDAAQETMLRHALRSAYSTAETPPELRGRVADRALLYAQQQVMQPDRILFSLRQCLKQMAVGAVCAVALLTVLAWPNIQTAYILYRMQSAIVHAHTLSVYTRYMVRTEVTPLHKTPRTNFEMNWGQLQNGKWHIESTRDEDARFDGKHIVWDDSPLRASHKAHDLSVINPIFLAESFRWVGDISLTASPASTATYGLFSRLDKEREMDVNGRRIIIYVWSSPSYVHTRTRIWLDARNYAPVQIEFEEKHSGASVYQYHTITRIGVDGPLQGGL